MSRRGAVRGFGARSQVGGGGHSQAPAVYEVDEVVVLTGCTIHSDVDYRQRDGEDLTEVDVGVSRMARASMLSITRSSVNSEQVAGG